MDLGFPSAEAFLWRRIRREGRKPFSTGMRGTHNESGRRMRLRHNNFKRLGLLSSRATPPHRQNLLDVALFGSDAWSEMADYKG